VPSGLGKSDVPKANARRAGDTSVANIDTAVEVADREGLKHPMTVALPGDGKGAFSAIGYAFNDPADERTVHVDQYGSGVTSTYGYDDYPVLAKTVSQGIALHEGRRFGTTNLWVTAGWWWQVKDSNLRRQCRRFLQTDVCGALPSPGEKSNQDVGTHSTRTTAAARVEGASCGARLVRGRFLHGGAGFL
jgi:hypothetical protein